MDANQDTMLRELHGAAFNPVESLSPFRLPDEGPIWQQHQMPINDDGMIHPQYVEWAARRGDSRELTRLQTVAAMTDPDRAEDAALAQQVIAAVASGAPPVIAPPPIPVGPVGPVTPPTPDTPVTQTPITLAQLLSWGRDAVTIIGTLGTWATAIHGVLGQFLPGASAVAVPSAFATATAVSAGHQLHQKRQLQKALAPRKAE